MAGGKWSATELPTRAGLYINFVDAAAAQITGGARGVVAIALKAFGGKAQASKFYTIETEKQAIDTLGADNIASVKRILRGGAKEVLVYTLPSGKQDEGVYKAAFEAFDARPFNVFVFDGEVTSAIQDAALAWVKRNMDEGKHFNIVFGCAESEDDTDPTVGDARSARLKAKYAVNLVNGVIENGVAVKSAAFAPYIAGLIAGTAINKSVTFVQIPVDDVTKRYTNAQVKAALAKGSFVLVHDGEKVKCERGITTDLSKLRKVRAEMAIATDIQRTGEDSYIGQLDNNADGQAALCSAIKAYLENLAKSNVLVMDSISVKLDPQFESKGDQVYLAISFVEVDSMEQIFISINVGGDE